MGGSAVTVSNGGLGGSGAAAWDATGGWSHDFGMGKVSVGIWSAWLGNAASWCRCGLFGSWTSNWAALEGDADLLGVLFMLSVLVGAITTVVAIVLSDLLVDGVHDDTGDWGIIQKVMYYLVKMSGIFGFIDCFIKIVLLKQSKMCYYKTEYQPYVNYCLFRL